MQQPRASERLFDFEIQRQPDDTSCGPTCLHAVYRHYGDDIDFPTLLSEVPTLDAGGTLGVLLASHALTRGYEATVLTWNLEVFDPTWFNRDAGPMAPRLRARAEARPDPKLSFTARTYADFLDAGGTVELCDLSPGLLMGFLEEGIPVIAGLSATFLYREARERGDVDEPDDIFGDPAGHFTILTGYVPATREVFVTDPLHPNALSTEHTYPVSIERAIGAIYLGVLTYDANLIVLRPRH
ncbi:MAG: hypothetical protein P1V81_05015 [Planctomycetota bacterium]|nr:hypothetical protein [Planctomycetota bacterium]